MTHKAYHVMASAGKEVVVFFKHCVKGGQSLGHQCQK